MADVKNVITLGIGAAPGGLVWFFTGGLESGEEVVVYATSITMAVPYREYAMTVPYHSHTMTVPLHSRTMTVPRQIGMEADA